MKLAGDDGVLDQKFEGNDFEGVLVSGFENDRAGCPGLLDFQPTGSTDAPAVAGLEPMLLATNEREYRTVARRPKYSALSNAKMERCGVEPMPPLERAVEMYLTARESYFKQK